MDAENVFGSVGLEVAAWVVTYALHSTALILAALLACAWIGRSARRSPRFADAAPALRERIGKVALLAGFVTASVQAALGVEPFGLRPALVDAPSAELVAAPTATPCFDVATPARTADTIAKPSTGSRPEFALPAVPLYLLPVVGAVQAATRTSAPAEPIASLPAGLGAVPASSAGDIADATPDTTPPQSAWVAGFLALWLLVAAAAFARRFVGWRALQQSLLGSEPVTDVDVLARFERLCRRAGVAHAGARGATLRIAPLLAAPLTRGILRPEVCIPPRALRDLDAEELTALLGHELAHAARRDPAWLIVFRALEVAFCLQPLNRVIARRLEDDAELLCDDRAVVWTGERIPLASCLTEVASWLVPAAREPRLAVGMAAHGARLTRRVERLVDESHVPDAGSRRVFSTLGALAFAAAAVGVVPGFAAQRSSKPLPLDLRLELALASPLTGVHEVSETDADADGVPAEAGTVGLEAEPERAARSRGAPPDSAEPDSAEPDCAEPDSAEPAPPDTAAQAVPIGADARPLASVLRDLDLELASLREELRGRDGDVAVARDLDALAHRIDALRVREAQVAALLAAHPTILLSPDEAGRSAEEH